MGVEERRPALLRFARRLVVDASLAEDAVQDAYLCLYEQQAAGKEIPNEYGYLKVSIRHNVIDTLRKNAKQDQLEHELAAGGTTPLTRAYLSQRFLEKLTLKQYMAYDLVELDGLTHAEAAKQLGISERAVGARLGRALKRIKEIS